MAYDESLRKDASGTPLTSLATTLDKINDSITAYNASTTGTPVDTSDNTTTVRTGATIIEGVYINTTLSAHTVLIQDNATTILTVPASATAGTYIPVPSAACATSLVVNPDDSSTGNITVYWRAA